ESKRGTKRQRSPSPDPVDGSGSGSSSLSSGPAIGVALAGAGSGAAAAAAVEPQSHGQRKPVASVRARAALLDQAADDMGDGLDRKHGGPARKPVAADRAAARSAETEHPDADFEPDGSETGGDMGGVYVE